jgi:selenide,water dikinase
VDDPYDYGQVAATNSVSDVYAMGGTPLTALAILCVPEHTLPDGVVREILRGGQDKLREAGVSILGGHSVKDPELKFGYSVTGVVSRRRMLTNSGARPGDRLVLTKPLGTGVLSTALKNQKLDARGLKRLTRSMTTLNRAASEAAVEYGARAATDVTGFGMIGHALQMADASSASVRLRPRSDWFMPRALEFAALGIAPGGLKSNRDFFGPRVREGGAAEPIRAALYDPQTSGGLLIAIAPRRLAGLLAALRRRRVWYVEAGEVMPRGDQAVELEAG